MNERSSSTLCAETEYLGLGEEPPAGKPEAAPEPPARVLEDAQLLWAARRKLGKWFLAGLLAGITVGLLIPSRYESTAQLMPPDGQSTGGIAALAALAAKSTGGMGMMTGDLLGVRSSGSLFVGILHSRTIQDRLIDRFQLKHVYGARLEEDARQRLAQNTGAAEDRKSGIITLTVTDRDRERARRMAAAYVEELNRLVAELSTSAARRERVFLEERLASVKKDLDEAAHELSEFSSRNAAPDVKEQARAMVEAAANLQGELIAAQSERQALATVYTPNNVRVRAAQARVNELQKQLERLGGEDEGAQPAPATSGLPYPSLRKLPLLGEKYAELYRKTAIEGAVFETLTQQYEIAKVEEAKETPSVKVLDDASFPERRSFPPRALIALAAAATASLSFSAWVLAKRRWQRMDERDRRKRLAAQILDDVRAVMPWTNPGGSRWQAASHQAWVRVMSQVSGRRRERRGL